MEEKRPNTQLRRERELKGWSQRMVAEQIETNPQTVTRWELGENKPSRYFQTKLCELFGKSAEELGFMDYPLTAKDEAMSRIDTYSRNEYTETTLSVPQNGTITPIPMPSAITTEEFLLQCSSSIKACWHLLRGKELILADEVLSTILSPLVKLVIQPSKYQSIAARIVTEAYMMRAIIAKHHMNFTLREVSCYEAVKYSRLAEDSILHAAALMYLAYTYIFIPAPRPKRAVEIFLEALHVLRDTAPLLKSDICMGLADAYAQCKEERAACQYAQLAHAHFPVDPEYDPSHLYADCALDTVL